MSISYFPFNSVVKGGIPDRAANAEDLAAYLKPFFTNGVILKESTALQVYAGDGLSIQVKPGMGFVNGKIFISDATEIIEIETPGATQNRIDRIVLRLDEVNRLMELAVLKGELASEPTAPAITQNSEVYELCLADVFVGYAVTEIAQANITDTRADEELCGIVAAAMKQIDTSTFYAQFESQFNAWFDTVRDTTASQTIAGVNAALQELDRIVDAHLIDFNSHIKNLGITSGTAAAYVITLDGYEVKEYDSIMILPHADCRAGATLAVNDVTGGIYKTDGTAASAGDIKSDIPVVLTYYGGKYFFKSGGSSSMKVTAGDMQLYLDTSSTSTTEMDMEKMKAVKIHADGTVRVKVTAYADTYAELEIRKNNTAVFQTEVESDETNHKYQMDVSISKGDEIALWGRTNGNFGKFMAVNRFEIGTDKGMLLEKLL